jgi:hypothetical protein
MGAIITSKSRPSNSRCSFMESGGAPDVSPLARSRDLGIGPGLAGRFDRVLLSWGSGGRSSDNSSSNNNDNSYSNNMESVVVAEPLRIGLRRMSLIL